MVWGTLDIKLKKWFGGNGMEVGKFGGNHFKKPAWGAGPGKKVSSTVKRLTQDQLNTIKSNDKLHEKYVLRDIKITPRSDASTESLSSGGSEPSYRSSTVASGASIRTKFKPDTSKDMKYKPIQKTKPETPHETNNQRTDNSLKSEEEIKSDKRTKAMHAVINEKLDSLDKYKGRNVTFDGQEISVEDMKEKLTNALKETEVTLMDKMYHFMNMRLS